MKNKIVMFGLVSVLTIGTAVGVLARDQNASFMDKGNMKVEQLKESEKNDIEINLANKELAITEEAAKKIALDSVVNGIFVEIDLEDEDGIIVYEVEVKSGDLTHEIEIDSNTGIVLKDDIDEDDHDDDEVINIDVKLTENEAIEIAKRSLDGKGEVTKIELEKEDGVIVYDIELNINNREFDIEVDANTGEIISQEEDN